MKTLGIIGFGAQLFFPGQTRGRLLGAANLRGLRASEKKIWSRQKKTL